MSLATIRSNPLMLTDTYNLSHQRLKINTDWEVSHIYNRKEGMILYGFTEMINSILGTQITLEMIKQAEDGAKKMGLIFPSELFEKVITECNGYFPIRVESLLEGTWCPKGTPFAQISNTEEGYGELVTYLEDIMLHSSSSCGTATEAFHMRQYLEDLKKEKGYDDSFLLRIHSFGFRGYQGGLESAYWGGTSWNLFLYGTDDFHTIMHTPNAKIGSISALAHKVTQQYDFEYEGYIHAIDETAEVGEKIIALVIDTYDANRFIAEYLVPLARYASNLGVHLVIRPDSGDVKQQVLDIYEQTQKHVLNNVTALIGENMSRVNVVLYDKFFEENNVPLTFVNYGIGAGFYNHITRDTLGFAMKTAYSNGKPRMKFSMEALKRSIPSEVEVLLEDDGTLKIETRSKLTPEEVILKSCYRIVYFFDKDLKHPYLKVENWDTTQCRALENLNKELQKEIVLSENIKELVKEFEKTYG